MKFILALIPAILFAITPAFASNGTATSYSSVTTNIQGSGTTTTHIETTVNGITKTLDSNTPGTYTLGVSSDEEDTVIPTVTIPIPTITLPVTPYLTITPSRPHKTVFLHQSFFDALKNFFHKLFSWR